MQWVEDPGTRDFPPPARDLILHAVAKNRCSSPFSLRAKKVGRRRDSDSFSSDPFL